MKNTLSKVLMMLTLLVVTGSAMAEVAVNFSPEYQRRPTDEADRLVKVTPPGETKERIFLIRENEVDRDIHYSAPVGYVITDESLSDRVLKPKE